MQSHGITLSFHREMADSSRELVGLAFAHLLEKLGKGWPVFSCAFRLRPLVGSNGWQYLNLQPTDFGRPCVPGFAHLAHGGSLCGHRVPPLEAKGADLSRPAEAPDPRARSSRNGGRHHLGTVGDIIPE